jgi:maltose O-acetyltransferase
MAYGKKVQNNNPLISIKIKFARFLAAHFPLNAVRIMGLRLCGFKVGKKVYIGSRLTLTMFNAKTNCDLEIGQRVSMAPNVTLILASDANWSRLSRHFEPIEGKIIIEEDCWLGANAVILPNVRIGKMSIVAAGAVVTKDVPPYTVVAGVPAKTIKQIEPL